MEKYSTTPKRHIQKNIYAYRQLNTKPTETHIKKWISGISIRESSVMNVKDILFQISQGHMMQKTRNLPLAVNLMQKCPTFDKKHDIDDHLAIWFSSMRLQLENSYQ